jgi:hypothetical protein
MNPHIARRGVPHGSGLGAPPGRAGAGSHPAYR